MTTIYVIIGILTAIVTAAWTYNMARVEKSNSTIAVICGCLVSAICGIFWLPMALCAIVFFAKELRHM